MIKCYIVQNIKETNKFEMDKFYIAKISGNGNNTYSVLDKNKNWIPFNCYSLDGISDTYKDYFVEYFEFHVQNKKELNNYIESTKIYN